MYKGCATGEGGLLGRSIVVEVDQMTAGMAPPSRLSPVGGGKGPWSHMRFSSQAQMPCRRCCQSNTQTYPRGREKAIFFLQRVHARMMDVLLDFFMSKRVR
jgi:hypothetical protein